MHVSRLALRALIPLTLLPLHSEADEIEIPGGRLKAPAGCRGGVTAGVDDLSGTIFCRSSSLAIDVRGGMFHACSDKKGSADPSTTYIPERLDLKTREGLALCLSHRYLGDQMEVTVGLADHQLLFRADVKDGADFLILLATAASYRRDAR